MQAAAPAQITAEDRLQLEATTESKVRPSRFRTACAFLKNGTCSKTLMTVIDRELGHPMKLEEAATDPLAGGLMQGYQCGMLWGSTLAAGAQAHRRHGPGPRAEAAAVGAAQRLVEAFRGCNGHLNCLEITETDPQDSWRTFVHFFLKGGLVTCIRRAGSFAPRALEAIEEVTEDDGAVDGGTVDGGTGKDRQGRCANCAALLARRLGASEQQVTMAAGLAGGIGLSGGACGALGAAIWLVSMRGRAQGDKSKVIMSRSQALFERFLKRADYELECAEIVGRTFDGAEDLAAHVRRGGCAELIEALAAAAEAVLEQRPAPADDEAVYSGAEADAA